MVCDGPRPTDLVTPVAEDVKVEKTNHSGEKKIHHGEKTNTNGEKTNTKVKRLTPPR